VSTRLTVLHREGCGLCDEMLHELRALAERVPLPAHTVIDVDSDRELARRYGLNVPVLLLDGALVCRHRLDEAELLRMLRVKPEV
jgi:hypothetical protein